MGHKHGSLSRRVTRGFPGRQGKDDPGSGKELWQRPRGRPSEEGAGGQATHPGGLGSERQWHQNLAWHET